MIFVIHSDISKMFFTLNSNIFQANTRLQNTMGSIRTGILDRRQSILNISTELNDSTADRRMGFDWYVSTLVNTAHIIIL